MTHLTTNWFPYKLNVKHIQTTVEDHQVAKLAAFAIALHMIEAVIPSPLPGVKPGIANIITLFVLYRYGFATAAWVSILRVFAKMCIRDRDGIAAVAKSDAPGVYVADAKIASLGLRIKNNCCYHGLSLNIHMDLSPFQQIDPCGYVGLKVTQTHNLKSELNLENAGEFLVKKLTQQLQTFFDAL